MIDVIEAEWRIGRMLLELGCIEVDRGARSDHRSDGVDCGGDAVHWPVRFNVGEGGARCTARVYERFNGSVVLCIDSRVATVDESSDIHHWATRFTGWMPFVQVRLDRRSDGRVMVIATHSLLAEDVSVKSLEQVVGSMNHAVPRWSASVNSLGAGSRNSACSLDLDPDPELDPTDDGDINEIDDLDADLDCQRRVVEPAVGESGGIDAALTELDTLVGLESVKSFVRQLIATHEVARRRRRHGLKVLEPSPHLVLAGNPGTGKTTVARCLGRIYRELGLLSEGHVVEVDRAGLVAGYVGQTAIKTRQALDAASGGVLFIDEAYSLVGDSVHDYGSEAIETILARMENNRGDLVVVAAGYPAQMKTFLASNPGLVSRFDRTVEFPDYSDHELVRIFCDLCAAHDYRMSDNGLEALGGIVSGWGRGHGFGNAREVRRLFHDVVGVHSQWIVDHGITSVDGLGTLDARHFAAAAAGSGHGSASRIGAVAAGYL